MPDASHPPLALPSDNWRSRWLITANAMRLHRVSEVVWEDGEEMIAGHALTVCGRRGRMSMPGIFSRMGLPRCAHCCRALGIPQGDGAPKNALIGTEHADA